MVGLLFEICIVDASIFTARESVRLWCLWVCLWVSCRGGWCVVSV